MKTVEHGDSGRTQPASDGKRDWRDRIVERPICTCGAEMKWDGDGGKYLCPTEYYNSAVPT